MSLADPRWRYVGAVFVALGAVVIFIGNLGDGTFLGLPSTMVGGGIVGIGVAAFVLHRDAVKKGQSGDPPD